MCTHVDHFFQSACTCTSKNGPNFHFTTAPSPRFFSTLFISIQQTKLGNGPRDTHLVPDVFQVCSEVLLCTVQEPLGLKVSGTKGQEVNSCESGLLT